MSKTPPMPEEFATLVRSLFRGEAEAWPPGFSHLKADEFIRLTRVHGIQPLIAYHLSRSGSNWPPVVVGAIQHELRRQMAFSVIGHNQLRAILDGLAEADIPFLILKGTALALRYYPDPCLRPRLDTDLFVDENALPRLERRFRDIGLACVPTVRGKLISHQVSYSKGDLVLDVHWKISNLNLVSWCLTFSEAMAESVPLQELGPTARTLSRRHLLLHACLHRVCHHFNDENLLWLYDIHLLAHRLALDEFEDFLTLGREKRVASLCLAGLVLARRWFGTELPYADGRLEKLIDTLTEPAAELLSPKASRKHYVRIDFKNLSMRDKGRFVLENLFPDRGYMVEKYGFSNPIWLPYFYLKRIFGGVLKDNNQ